MSVTDWCVWNYVFFCSFFACKSILCQKRSYGINFWSVTLSMTSFLMYTRLLTLATCLVVVTWYIITSHDFFSRATIVAGKVCKGCDKKDCQFVMIDSWDICSTRNVHKEGSLITTTFFNAWILFTCISESSVVHICYKKALNDAYFPVFSWRTYTYNQSGHFWGKCTVTWIFAL